MSNSVSFFQRIQDPSESTSLIFQESNRRLIAVVANLAMMIVGIGLIVLGSKAVSIEGLGIGTGAIIAGALIITCTSIALIYISPLCKGNPTVEDCLP